jgi:hypothetical protein
MYQAAPVTGCGGTEVCETLRLSHFPDDEDGSDTVSHMCQVAAIYHAERLNCIEIYRNFGGMYSVPLSSESDSKLAWKTVNELPPHYTMSHSKVQTFA